MKESSFLSSEFFLSHNPLCLQIASDPLCDVHWIQSSEYQNVNLELIVINHSISLIHEFVSSTSIHETMPEDLVI